MVLLEQIGFWARVGITLGTTAKRIVTALIPNDPLSIKTNAYDKHQPKIDVLASSLRTDKVTNTPSSTPDEIQRLGEPLRKQGTKFCQKARSLWGKEPLANKHRCAWNYVLAAECYEKASDWKAASHLYHWAAHQFRNAGEPGFAKDYYVYSGIMAHKDTNEILTERSLRRANGTCHTIGESFDLDTILNRLKLSDRNQAGEKIRKGLFA